MPTKERRARDKLKKNLPPAQAYTLPLSNPLCGMPADQRAELARVSRRSARRVTKLPAKWRDLITACMVGSGQLDDGAIAAVLGVNVRTLKDWKRDLPELADHMAACNANVRAIVVGGLYQRAREGDPDAQRWYAERNWPDLFGPRATPNQVNVQVNTQAPAVPPSMTAAEYMKLIAAAQQQALPAPPPAQAQPLPAPRHEVPSGR